MIAAADDAGRMVNAILSAPSYAIYCPWGKVLLRSQPLCDNSRVKPHAGAYSK